MPRFQINIEGRHFLSASQEGAGLSQPVGFCVVRYVKAEDEATAQAYVLDYFKKEVESKLISTSRSTVRVTEVRPVESMEGTAFFEGGISGTEIMTYPESSGPDGSSFWQSFAERLTDPIRSLFSRSKS